MTRRDRHLRTRRPRRAATRPRLLHRRRGAAADRDRPRAGTRARSWTSSARICFRFLVDSQGVTGRTRNRRDADGRWHGRRGVEDCWGRSVWAFGTAAAPGSRRSGCAASALSYFDHAVGQRSPHRRAMAFAALGAAEVLAVEPRHAARTASCSPTRSTRSAASRPIPHGRGPRRGCRTPTPRCPRR